MIHCFVGMQGSQSRCVCSASSRYTEESLCGCNTTPYFTPLWLCRGVKVSPAIPGKGVPCECLHPVFTQQH